MTEIEHLTRLIEELQDTAAPAGATSLAKLSDLNADEAATIFEALREVSFEYRRQIVHRLADLAEENVDLNFESIFRLSLEDEDEEVRETAIVGLWECEERSLITPLLRFLKWDPEERVRAAAALSLGRFAMLAELGKLLERDARRVEAGLLETIENFDESLDVRRRAIEALAAIDTPEVREIIQETYESQDEKLRASAVYAMGRNADPFWLPYVLDELSSPAAEIRYEAAGAAGEIGDDAAIPALAELIRDDDPEIQARALTALGAIGGSASEQILRQALENPDVHVREAAHEALEALRTRRSPLRTDAESFDLPGEDEDDDLDDPDDEDEDDL